MPRRGYNKAEVFDILWRMGERFVVEVGRVLGGPDMPVGDE